MIISYLPRKFYTNLLYSFSASQFWPFLNLKFWGGPNRNPDHLKNFYRLFRGDLSTFRKRFIAVCQIVFEQGRLLSFSKNEKKIWGQTPHPIISITELAPR